MAIFNVTIDHTKVPGDLTDYVVYVDLSDMPAGFWSVVSNGGGDIRTYKSDGVTELAREVVSCDTGTDTGELHIKYTGTLSSTVDTVIKVVVDGVSSAYAATDTYGRNAVWSNFVSVWHLNESSGSRLDSKANTYDLTDNNTVGTVTGKIGTAASFILANSEYLSNTSVGGALTNSWSFVGWINFPNIGAVDQTIFSLRQGAGNNNLVQVETKMDVPRVRALAFTSGGASAKDYRKDSGFSADTWAHVAVTWDGSTFELYVNASNGSVTKTTDTAMTQTSTSRTLRLAAETAASNFADGDIDEFRVLSSALSANWVQTDFNNQDSPGTFYSIVESAYEASVSDTITVSESVTGLKILTISVSDSLTVAETVNVLLNIQLSLADTFSINESITAQVALFLSLSDSLSVTESVSARDGLMLAVFDSISIGENLAISTAIGISVYELLLITEGITAQRPSISVQLPMDRYVGTVKKINMKASGSI